MTFTIFLPSHLPASVIACGVCSPTNPPTHLPSLPHPQPYPPRGMLPRALGVMFAAIARNVEIAAGRAPKGVAPQMVKAIGSMALHPTHSYSMSASFLEVPLPRTTGIS